MEKGSLMVSAQAVVKNVQNFVKLSKEEMGKAFIVMQENFHIIRGSVVRIGLSKTKPYKDLVIQELV